MTKEARQQILGKIVSSVNGAGKTGLHVKNEIRQFFNAIHKNTLKIN